MASKPYTVHDPFHSSSFYTLKRKAFCAGCVHNDDFLKDGREMLPGTQTVKVEISFGPSTRTQHFHPECYVHHLEHVRSALMNSTFKVYPIIDRSNVVDFPVSNEEILERRIIQACNEADDIAF